jgi:hypothetical protein
MRNFLAIAVSILALLAIASPAWAGNPNDTQYGNLAGKTKAPIGTHGVLASPTVQGTLPFTGLELGFVAGAALIVVAGGAGLRWLGRKQTQQQ